MILVDAIASISASIEDITSELDKPSKWKLPKKFIYIVATIL